MAFEPYLSAHLVSSFCLCSRSVRGVWCFDVLCCFRFFDPPSTLAAGTMNRQNRTTMRSLTGIRFFAALYVVVYHLFGPQFPHKVWPIRNFVLSGHIGVSFFFILSGFVITYQYSCRIDGAADRKSFFWAPFARIYPTYIIALLATVLLTNNSEGLVASTLLIQSWFPSLALTPNGPGWSLSNEAFFYAVFPFALPL
jgi:peptidoglycan/LPS O-acetylase OafA/YrhL